MSGVFIRYGIEDAGQAKISAESLRVLPPLPLNRECSKLAKLFATAGIVVLVVAGCQEAEQMTEQAPSQQPAAPEKRPVPGKPIVPKKPTAPGGRVLAEDQVMALEPATPRDEEQWVQNALDALEPGKIAFKPPTQMYLGKTETLEVRLAKDTVPEAEFLKDLKGGGTTQVEDIKIGSFMKVELLGGPAFDIEPLSSLEQLVVDDVATQWLFDVTPRESGQQKLKLRVTVRIHLPNGRQEQKDHPIKERDIKVRVGVVGLRYWLAEHWQWVVSAIIVPLVIAAWGYYRERQKEGSTKSETAAVKNSVFISYRRDDSKWFAQALNKTLSSALGEEHVFIDVADIDPGVDFTQALDQTLQKCDALIAVIGQDWLSAANERGRRLDDPKDYVRIEIATALKRGIRVIPALVDGTPMPKAGELPDDLKALAHRNAIDLRHTNFEASANRLIDILKRTLH